jgi:hypothetical protein
MDAIFKNGPIRGGREEPLFGEPFPKQSLPKKFAEEKKSTPFINHRQSARMSCNVRKDAKENYARSANCAAWRGPRTPKYEDRKQWNEQACGIFHFYLAFAPSGQHNQFGPNNRFFRKKPPHPPLSREGERAG